MTHAELVDRAVRWLVGTAQCTVVLRECGAFSWGAVMPAEIPDAIGWNSRGLSILVECKTSLSDLYADRRKQSQQQGKRCGTYRYVMTDCEDIKQSHLLPGWGLLRVGKVVRREGEAQPDDRCELSEIRLLVAELRRCVRRVGSNGLVDATMVAPELEETQAP